MTGGPSRAVALSLSRAIEGAGGDRRGGFGKLTALWFKSPLPVSCAQV